ncbi:MAG TPA: hypothetical protein VM864_12805 [Pyrinomonadaceae bacterium]|nr:hypothetical protein [Pyrinomonadaceae bacterium]
MAKKAGGKTAAARGEQRSGSRVSKKDQILSLFMSGITEVEDLAMITGSRPSYVGATLQDAGLKTGYFDLYTSSSHPMNVYSKFFAGQLGFRDEETARASVEVLERLYGQFGLAGDRAGQHHALSMALTMYDRARWTGKAAEANIFREWLLANVEEAVASTEEADEEESGEGAAGAAGA